MSYKHNCKFRKYFRTINSLLDNKYDDIFLYNNNNSYLPIHNLHWGQVKLLYSEIEFLTKVSKDIELSNCIVVYIGAAPGDHTCLLLDLFQTMSMLLYDPREFNNKLVDHPRVTIRTGTNGLFSDDSIDEVRKIANNRKIIFISDIRREVDEVKILEDMINQQRWAILLDSEYILLKLRMPYLTIDEYKYLNYDMSTIQNKVIINDSNATNDGLMYLDGKIYTQIYPKIKSTETRLFVKKDNKNKYNMKYYSIYNYDKALSYYNIYLRPQMYEYKDSKDAQKYVLGFDNSYDSVGEYYILYKYVKHFVKDNNNYDKTIDMINELTTKFNYETNKNVFTIQIKHYNDELQNILKTIKQDPNTNNITNYINYVRELYKYVYDLPEIYKSQYELIDSQKNSISKKALESFDKTSSKLVLLNKSSFIFSKQFVTLLNNVSKELIKVYNN